MVLWSYAPSTMLMVVIDFELELLSMWVSSFYTLNAIAIKASCFTAQQNSFLN